MNNISDTEGTDEIKIDSPYPQIPKVFNISKVTVQIFAYKGFF